MTCFWDGIMRELKNNYIELPICTIHLNTHTFATFLKSRNTKTYNINWSGSDSKLVSGTHLPEKLLNENYKSIQEFDVNSIYNGYDCSTCDPFLLLICELFYVSIIHNFNGIIIKYTNTYKNRAILQFHSNSHHFW